MKPCTILGHEPQAPGDGEDIGDPPGHDAPPPTGTRRTGPSDVDPMSFSGDGDIEKSSLTLGFIPLTDCAPLVVAQEKGYFAAQGLDVTLTREASWSAVRDKLAFGLIDAAHMLAGIPLASTLGVSGVQTPMITALSLGLNGNGVTVSTDLYQRMVDADPRVMSHRPITAAALKKVIDARPAGEPPLTFAVVFPFSSHHYQLRYWMAAGGIDPERDVRLIVVPPAQMVRSLSAGTIDGFCVGSPWSTAAVEQGVGRLVVTGHEIWNNAPEKVLGVSAAWAAQNPGTHRALIRGVLRAAMWIEKPENRPETAEILSREEYVGVPAPVLSESIVSSNHVFFSHAATFPWRSHAVWTLAQMRRWGQIPADVDLHAIAAQVYRPDIYREVATEMRLPHPRCDMKTEGHHSSEWHMPTDGPTIVMGPDRFIDGEIFNPRNVEVVV